MAQLQWLTHNDRRVLLLDFSEHSEKRIEEIVREVQQVITAPSPGSVLVLADFTGVTASCGQNGHSGRPELHPPSPGDTRPTGDLVPACVPGFR